MTIVKVSNKNSSSSRSNNRSSISSSSNSNSCTRSSNLFHVSTADKVAYPGKFSYFQCASSGVKKIKVKLLKAKVFDYS